MNPSVSEVEQELKLAVARLEGILPLSVWAAESIEQADADKLSLDLLGPIYERAGGTVTADERFMSNSPARDKRLAVV